MGLSRRVVLRPTKGVLYTDLDLGGSGDAAEGIMHGFGG
jgi:hypothetical protein